MRTTVNIDESLLTAAKQIAARDRRALGDVLDDALRVFLTRPTSEEGQREVHLPTFGGSGLQPGIDLEDKDALAALLDDSAPR